MGERRKELLMERQEYVGGVNEEQRSEQERRFEELGLGGLLLELHPASELR